MFFRMRKRWHVILSKFSKPNAVRTPHATAFLQRRSLIDDSAVGDRCYNVPARPLHIWREAGQFFANALRITRSPLVTRVSPNIRVIRAIRGLVSIRVHSWLESADGCG
jgi:hypothetical protein